MKFLHTADWQIGMKADHVGAAAEKVREQRLESVRRLIKAAQKDSVEFILAAGDLFEDNGVDRTLIINIADILSGCGMPVFVIPGNHDPYVPGSVWSHSAWKSGNDVSILSEENPVDVPGGVLFPCPVRDKYATKNPTAWISVPDEPVDTIRIGIAHGNVVGLPKADPDHPIPRDAAERLKLDYLALGHWHSTATYPNPDGIIHMAYSGTPETSSFGERDSGFALIVEIDSPGAAPRIRPVRTGGLRWIAPSRELRSSDELRRIRNEIEALEDPGQILISFTLAGVLHAADIQSLKELEDLLRTRFLYSRLDSSKLRPTPEDSSWIEDLPPGHIREAAERLRSKAASEEEGAETAARALLELYAVAIEVRS